MAWRDQLRPASFRGVPFFIETVDADQGRRVEIIRYPGREETTAQDLGRDASEFAISAYVIGPDYISARQALETALLTRGPGKLVLPTRGELQVVIAPKFKTHESRDHGGMATISFSCTVSTPRTNFTQAYEPGALRAICDDLIDGSTERAASAINVSGLSSGTVASHTSLIQRMTTAMTTANSTVASVVGNVAGTASTIGNLSSQAETLLATPETIASMLGSAFESMFMDIADLVTNGASILERDFDASFIGLRQKCVRTAKRALAQIQDVEFSVSLNTSTANLERETANLKALSALYRVQSVAAFARAVPDLPWSSYQEAIAGRDFLVGVIQDMEGDVDDDDYEALRDLRVATSRYLSSTALRLPVLRTYQARGETCALLIAHELYGDARRESEIVARNNLPNPANVAPSLTLEVSSV